MTDRRRNRIVLAIVGGLLVLSLLVIVPGGPFSKKTQLGLDLRGGIELVYQAEPTPQVPKVTPQAVSDAINTIRKRTNALGVSESEVQQQGRDQVDIGLPGGMDGYELARRIRSHPAGANVRLVALTGYGFPEDRMLSRQAGFARHLVKPVEPEALNRELSAVQPSRPN